jgi:hypothetical protein
LKLVPLCADTEGSLTNTKKVLYIEKKFRKDLFEAHPADPEASVEPIASQDGVFCPPMAAVNYGNSALFDGSITCFVAKKEWCNEGKWQTNPVKFTAMNQAKDKLGYSGEPKGALPVSKLRTHAERCNDPVLNGLFGMKRLLFVSTPSTMNAKGKVRVPRCWLPRALDKCEILAELMSTLASQRTRKENKETYTDCVDEKGKLVTDLDDVTKQGS